MSRGAEAPTSTVRADGIDDRPGKGSQPFDKPRLASHRRFPACTEEALTND